MESVRLSISLDMFASSVDLGRSGKTKAGEDCELKDFDQPDVSLELLREQLAELRAEHQCCLDGDQAWAEKWRLKYEDTAAQRDDMLAALKAIVSAYDGSFTPLAAISRTMPVVRAAIAKAEGR